MGANRWAQQFNYTYYAGVHYIFGKTTIGATGAPTLVTAQSRGITSITRTAAGKYRLVLDSKYPYLLDAGISHMSPSLQSTAIKLTAEDTDGATPYVDFAVTNPLSGVARSVPTGITEVQTLTCLAKASVVDGDYIVITDNVGGTWAVAIDATGATAAPTGAKWTAVAAANKGQADISGATSNADVAAIVYTTLNALTGFTAKFTLTDNSDGTITVSWDDKREQIVLADPQKTNDAAAGTSIVSVEATGGREGSVSIANDTIQIMNHNFPTALPVKAYGSNGVPTGITDGTTYYVIVSDANNIQLATTAALAIAGTEINLTADATADGTLEIVPQTQAAEAVDPDSGDSLYFSLALRATDVR